MNLKESGLKTKANLLLSNFKISKYSFLFDIALFMIITVVFHKLWWLFSSEIKSIPAVLNLANWLAKQVFESSYYVIHLFVDKNAVTEAVNTIRFSNNGFITINESCSGLKQFYQIIILFLIFPGSWKNKAWFIPLSLVIMHITNVFRIIFLGIIVIWKPNQWHFIHDWIMRPFFYVVIFMLWVWWVEKYGGFTKRNNQL